MWNKPYPWAWDSPLNLEKSIICATFKDGGDVVSVAFEHEFEETGGGSSRDFVDVGWGRNDLHGDVITGRPQHRTVSTILNIILEYVKAIDPDQFIFGAYKGDVDRVGLYRAMISKFAVSTGYIPYTKDYDDAVGFFMVKELLTPTMDYDSILPWKL